MTFILGGALLAILGVISPVIISLLTKASMSAKAKQLVALAVTVVLAIVVAFVPALGGTAILVLNAGIPAFFESLFVAVPIIYTVQQVIYQFVFKGTEWAQSLLDSGVQDKGADVDENEVEAEVEAESIDESVFEGGDVETSEGN